MTFVRAQIAAENAAAALAAALLAIDPASCRGGSGGCGSCGGGRDCEMRRIWRWRRPRDCEEERLAVVRGTGREFDWLIVANALQAKDGCARRHMNGNALAA